MQRVGGVGRGVREGHFAELENKYTTVKRQDFWVVLSALLGCDHELTERPVSRTSELGLHGDGRQSRAGELQKCG